MIAVLFWVLVALTLVLSTSKTLEGVTACVACYIGCVACLWQMGALF